MLPRDCERRTSERLNANNCGSSGWHSSFRIMSSFNKGPGPGTKEGPRGLIKASGSALWIGRRDAGKLLRRASKLPARTHGVTFVSYVSRFYGRINGFARLRDERLAREAGRSRLNPGPGSGRYYCERHRVRRYRTTVIRVGCEKCCRYFIYIYDSVFD